MDNTYARHARVVTGSEVECFPQAHKSGTVRIDRIDSALARPSLPTRAPSHPAMAAATLRMGHTRDTHLNDRAMLQRIANGSPDVAVDNKNDLDGESTSVQREIDAITVGYHTTGRW